MNSGKVLELVKVAQHHLDLDRLGLVNTACQYNLVNAAE
ncbi:MAG: hypothetical protein HW374_1248 [Bacteroidetes bacterium]|nr:hypothetical protein [Bacteroidota bacterium]